MNIGIMEKKRTKKHHSRAVLRIAGAFIAWMIGSGFATGQEILQFFSSYSYISYGILLFNFLGFVVLGRILLATGSDHQERTFDHFTYYCGKKIGKVYSWLIPLTLILIISVMTSAAGSTLSEYYGVNRHIGSVLMAMTVVGAYLIGFEKLIRIVSSIGPVIIIFAFMVGAITTVRDSGNFMDIAQYEDALSKSNSSPNAILSAVLYLSLCLFTAGTYYTALGQTATDKNDAKLGATLGASAFIIVLAIMNTAILLNAKEITNLEIPTLYLATKISYTLAGIFSVILILGMFTSCSTMMWSVCSRFYIGEVRKNRIFAVVIGVVVMVLSQFSFSELMGIFYPFVGYVGLIYIGCVLWKGIK